MSLNKQVLSDLLSWGSDLEGFSKSHASDALMLAQGYMEGFNAADGTRVEGIGARDERITLLVAMNIAWLFWVDDRVDGGFVGAPKGLPEDSGFARLRVEIAEAARDEASLRLWLDEATNVVRAYHENHLLSRGERSWSYTEYLQNGETSVGVMQCVATIALLYGYDMQARLRDPRFQRMMRHLCLAMRLQNDLVSWAKERVEGDQANAVFFLKSLAPPPQALGFIVEQQKAYERLLDRDLAELRPSDPFARIANAMLAMTGRYYSSAPARYVVTPEEAAAERAPLGPYRMESEPIRLH